MAFNLTNERLKRYKDLVLLILKYGNKNFAAPDDPLQTEDPLADNETKEKADELASDLESMGPTFIKLGQLLSTRPDFLPKSYIQALTRLQDKVEPFPFEKVEDIIAVELGVRLSKAFQKFESIPIAAASLGQVHYAVLRDGREVAVKVQRPDIKSVISEDLKALEDIASSLEKHTDVGRRFAFNDILNEFKQSLILELNYIKEAQNLTKLGNNLKEYKNIIVPSPIMDYTTERVLTMEYIPGVKITKLSPLARLEINGAELAEDLFKAYLDQVLVDGFFHADPHPGNVFVTDDHKIALIDLGMTAKVEPGIREKLLKLLLHVSEGRGHEAAMVGKEISEPLEDYDEEAYVRSVKEFVSQYLDATLEEIKVGVVVMQLTQIATESGLKAPSELTMLGKTLLNLDEIGKTLEPGFNPNKIIQEHAQSILQQHFIKSISPGNIFSSVLEVNEFLRKLPGRLNDLFDNLTHNKLSINVKAFDEIELMANMQKIANRITMGLILAALIVGAAIMMQVDTNFMVFGYPGIAIIFFLIAAICGLLLVFSIFMGDKWTRKRQKH
jgi:ubiquinone biosynthesis protein